MFEGDLIIRVNHDAVQLLDWAEVRILVELARGAMLDDSTTLRQFQEIMKAYLVDRMDNT